MSIHRASARAGSVLVVDDEPKILEVVSAFMGRCGFEVFSAATGREALEIFERENIALVLLDLMLPDMPGEDVCRAIRRRSRVPLIMLTAKIEEEDMLEGLELGADDYIRKPFSLRELGARAEAALRRASDDVVPLAAKSSFNGGDLTVNFETGAVRKRGAEVYLTPSEMKILAALIKYPGKIFNREKLIAAALGEDFDGYDRAVDSHVKNLRQKIETDPKNPRYILTVHGVGYKFGGT
ncbi:MAG: response regulator transcription factor [Oscillospiraceae bacterium]|jgi:DNA-binding response OmpR family regulator|nr:response regulator transcription factor [Oscillospiraceae bacterium]